MRSYKSPATILVLTWLVLIGPALAQNSSTSPRQPAPTGPSASAQNLPTPPADSQSFLDGLRRVGVMAGQVVECSPDADRQAQITQAMDLANLIAIHFGLRAAFTFVGALGYGSGYPFDKSGCAQAIESWTQIKAKYLGK